MLTLVNGKQQEQLFLLSSEKYFNLEKLLSQAKLIQKSLKILDTDTDSVKIKKKNNNIYDAVNFSCNAILTDSKYCRSLVYKNLLKKNSNVSYNFINLYKFKPIIKFVFFFSKIPVNPLTYGEAPLLCVGKIDLYFSHFINVQTLAKKKKLNHNKKKSQPTMQHSVITTTHSILTKIINCILHALNILVLGALMKILIFLHT